MTTELQLDIGGMTCAACAARIEKRLNRLDGVQAAVNYATEKATVVVADGTVGPGDLIAQVESIGYSATLPRPEPPTDAPEDRDDHVASVRRRFLVSAALAVPVIAISMVPAWQFDGWQWWCFALATPVVTWGGWPFHRSAWLNLRHRSATMDTLVSTGTIAAYTWSVVSLLTSGGGDGMSEMPGMDHAFSLTADRTAGHVYFEVAAGVIVFILAGRWFEARAKRRSGDAIRSLIALGAKDATVLRNGAEVLIPASTLAVGDRFVVRPGERIPTDGVIEDGMSAIDRSVMTGESVPVEAGPGDEVTGATVNTSGRLVVRATRVGSDTALAQMAKLVEEAQSGKADIQRLADRVAAVFVPIVIGLAVVTFLAWLVLARTDRVTAAFTAGVAVLIVACPCALGLATPMALMVGTGRGAQLGIIIKGPQVLESTRRVDTIVLDKTGTVTTGRMALMDVVAVEGTDRADLLRIGASIEAGSEHPIARAVVEGAHAEGVALGEVSGFRNAEGLGVTGEVDGRHVVVGRLRHLQALGIADLDRAEAARAQAEGAGRTPVFAAWDGVYRGAFVVTDHPKPNSAAAIESLRGLGLTPILLTGDNERAAHAVACQVGITEVIAEVLPADKVEVVRRLQAQGKVVAMVGDGVNDAAALATADLGLAIGTGADVAIEASDLTLVSGDLTGAADAIRLARRTLATIKGNLFWAFAYNVAALPVAAAGLLNPMLAGFAMACSSAFVVSNSLRLFRFHPLTRST